jgi:hypothetical protein
LRQKPFVCLVDTGFCEFFHTIIEMCDKKTVSDLNSYAKFSLINKPYSSKQWNLIAFQIWAQNL